MIIDNLKLGKTSQKDQREKYSEGDEEEFEELSKILAVEVED